MSQLKAILFADISGSSALYKTSGNQNAKQIVDFLLDTLAQIVTANNGKVIKSIGDEIMTCFDDCQDCLKAATEMQLKINSMSQQADLAISIGIGFGEVICDKQDLFGEAVNDAAYLTQIAQGGQILLNLGVYDQLNELSKIKVSEFDRVIIKGASVESLIYRYFWHEERSNDSETRLMSVDQVVHGLETVKLELTYKAQTIILTSDQTPFYLGRDGQKCDLKVEAESVSREHCQIKFSRGKFVLCDHSSNGCYITSSNKGEMYIRREEYPLLGKSVLSLGVRAAITPSNVIGVSLLSE